jgi:hypothetical protein
MNQRTVVTILGVMFFLGTAWGVLHQRQELAQLRGENDRRLAELAAAGHDSTQAPAPNDGEPASAVLDLGQGRASELLRLRSEVSRLTALRRELAGVVAEADRLRAQVAANLTNAPSGAPLPAGYIRKAQAQWMGFSTPEATLQSFLWAVQRHDFTNLLQVLTTEAAERLRSQFQQSGESLESFFKATDAMPGLAIQGRQDLQDGSVQLQVQFGPGIPPGELRLQSVNGEWKLVGPF